MATIEAKMGLRELEASSEYATLHRRFNELRTETELDAPTDEVYAEFATDKIRTLLN
jgi:hypothetical protein